MTDYKTLVKVLIYAELLEEIVAAQSAEISDKEEMPAAA